MIPRILLAGRNGQVGGDLFPLLAGLGEVIAPDRHQLDLLKADDLRRTIREVQPQLIVNAAAYTAVDRAESEESIARAINADAPLLMAEEAKKIGAVFVHYSTDYVFDGLKASPYEENDATNPVSVYGKTKLAGEHAIRETGVPHLIFRTAWIYSTRGRNFLLTILRLASERDELRIVCDQTGAPTWSHEIAQATTSVLAKLINTADPKLSFAAVTGTYHMTAGGGTTWYDFARAILGEASNAPSNLPWLASATGGRTLSAQRVVPVTTAEYVTPAHRPSYSVLSNALLDQTFDVRLTDWREQLKAVFGSKAVV
jgi:dTDP-4-dehydrorhamnose reductase